MQFGFGKKGAVVKVDDGIRDCGPGNLCKPVDKFALWDRVTDPQVGSLHMSKETCVSGVTEPTSRQIASALRIRSSRIFRAFIASHLWHLVHPSILLSFHSV